jgi:aminopeptidase
MTRPDEPNPEVPMRLSEAKMHKYGDVLLWALKTARKGAYEKGDIILVRYQLDAIRMAEVMQAKLLNVGYNPLLRVGFTPRMERNFYQRANRSQLVFQAPGERQLYEKLNGGIYILAPESLTHLSDVDPKKIGKAAVAAKPLRDILDKREEKGMFGWTLCLLPTPELARHAGLSLEEYTSEIGRACYLDKKDPVQAWKTIYENAMAIKKWINRLDIKKLRINSEGVDLTITPGKKRRWVGVSGHNIPSFEIFLSPDWRGTEGVYFADQPSFRNGNYVEGVRLLFKKGCAVNIEAHRGEDFVVKQLSMDKGARRVGEFSLTDRRFSRIRRFMANTLYDENHGGLYGNCHLALGASYSDTYNGDAAGLTRAKKETLGFNESALHWDLVNTEDKVVTAYLTSGEKKVIYENGMFRY